MSELGSVSFHDEDDLRVVSIAGEIDASNIELLHEDVLETLPNSALGLVLDLVRLDYIDSAGVAFVFEAAERLAKRGQALALVVPAASPILRSLEVTQVDEIAAIEATPEAARARVLRRDGKRTA